MSVVRAGRRQPDDESKTEADARGALAEDPRAAQGPSDPDDRPSDGLSDGSVLADDEWSEFRCRVCGADVTGYRKAQFDAHLRSDACRSSRPAPSPDDGRDCVAFCTWVCSVCGKESRWGVEEGSHGGPRHRSFDRRFAFATCPESRYPSHKRYLGKIDGARGPVVHYHKGLTFTAQPEQDDPSLAPFLVTKQKKERQTVGSSSKGEPGVQRAGRRAA